jgi:hypothetical protein
MKETSMGLPQPSAQQDMDKLINARIKKIAESSNHQPLGLAYHRPESWSQFRQCFENVERKVREAGGRTIFGWTFHHRLVEAIPGPGYLFLTHHAVWHAPDGHLIDVTPYPEPKHHPIAPGGGILFLVDANALPVQRANLIAPLPLRFFTLNNDERFDAHVAWLDEEEQKKCAEIYAGRSTLSAENRSLSTHQVNVMDRPKPAS